MKKRNNRKVVVGISGGVDSSVSLAILKERGFSPVGVFLKFWGKDNSCCGSEAERRARKVCDLMDVPFYTMDVRREFKERVVDYFLESYERGETPNPCVVCNPEIKFKTLFDKLKALDGRFVATGHYVKVKDQKMLEAEDKKKDQSYFLWNLKKRDLKRVVFPLGELTKKEVRKKAKKLNLPTSEISESQEACFIGGGLESFLDGCIDLIPGPIEDVNGNQLGEHIGLPLYTKGQRKRIGLSGGPFYVLEKDEERNVLTVTEDRSDLEERRVIFRNPNFFEKVTDSKKLKAKIRYNSPAKEGVLKDNEFIFSEPRLAITPGQSIVFYDGDKLIGGGIIS